MGSRNNHTPEISPEAMALWLKQLDRAYVHGEGWKVVNQRYHGVARAARPFILKHFPDAASQEAAFDGLTLALLSLEHCKDIGQLEALFTAYALKKS